MLGAHCAREEGHPGAIRPAPMKSAADAAKAVGAVLDAGADGGAKNDDNETPFDRAKKNEKLKGTDAYWALNDAQYN